MRSLRVLAGLRVTVCLLMAGSLSAGEGSPGMRVLDRIIAVAGDDIILESELDRFTAAHILPSKEGESPSAYRERVLDLLIVDLLRERELRATGGLEPDPQLVKEKFQQVTAAAEKAEGLPFDQILARAGVTRAEALSWISKGLALDTYLRDRLLPRIRLTPEDIQSFYEGPFRNEAASRGLTALPPLSAVQDDVQTLLRERRLNEEIRRWTEEIRQKTRIVIYRR